MPDARSLSADASALLDSMEGVAFITDLKGTILQVGRNNFDRFASIEGAGTDLNSDAVIGQNLFDYVTEGPVRDMVRRIHGRAVSDAEGTLTFELRCDSPKVERTILNTVRPIMEGGRPCAVLYQTITVSEKIRPPVLLVKRQDSVKVMWERESVRHLHMCSYCARVGLPFNAAQEDLTWVSGPEFYHMYGDYPVNITHGICGRCHDRLEEALDAPVAEGAVPLNFDPRDP